MRQMFSMTVPMDVVITNNRTAQVWRRGKTKDTIRALTRAAAAGLYPCSRASIYVGITKRTGTLYDPVNLTDTFKGCVDELVSMGVLDEDNHRYVTGPFLYHHGVDKHLPAKTLRATVTLTDYSPSPIFGGAS